MLKFLILLAVSAGMFAGSATSAQQTPAPPQMQIDAPTKIANPYSAYEFLIGDWYTKPSGGPDLRIHQQFAWGTEKGSIKYTTLTNVGAAPEAIHVLRPGRGRYAVDRSDQRQGLLRARRERPRYRRAAYKGDKLAPSHVRP